jgi:hypothetical protein
VNHDSRFADSDTDEVDPRGANCPGEGLHLAALRRAHGVDWIEIAGDGPHFDRHPGPTINGE